MNYRSRTYIVAQILDAAAGGSTKKKVMYEAFLSYAQLMDYLSILIHSSLLEYGPDRVYRTTPKGYRFLELYAGIKEFLPEEANRTRPKRQSQTEVLDLV